MRRIAHGVEHVVAVVVAAVVVAVASAARGRRAKEESYATA
jgi:hypothetical protein